jgi:adenosylcobinamide amidohydrolase
MNNAAFCHEKFSDLEVVAICTGGVERNSGRAGDPASYYEPQKSSANATSNQVEQVEIPKQGTINAMIFINRELTPGAMVTAVITATEAKSAVMQELEVPSRYSEGMATGTGTDQIAVAAKLGGDPISYAGKHSKLGELIGRTVHDAVKKTLALQNGLTPAGQCSSFAHLERLGINKRELCEGIGEFLSKDNADLFKQNFSNIVNDPLTVAAVAALVHLRDKFVWGILPESCIPEVMGRYGAQISEAVSGKSNLAKNGATPRARPAKSDSFSVSNHHLNSAKKRAIRKDSDHLFGWMHSTIALLQGRIDVDPPVRNSLPLVEVFLQYRFRVQILK